MVFPLEIYSKMDFAWPNAEIDQKMANHFLAKITLPDSYVATS